MRAAIGRCAVVALIMLAGACTSGPPYASSCRGQFLSGVVVDTAGGAGDLSYFVTLTNTGKPCSLRGYPASLTGVTSTGAQTPLQMYPLNADDERAKTSGKPADLGTGRAAELVVDSFIQCNGGKNPAAPLFAALRIGLAGSAGHVDATFEGHADGQAGVWLPCRISVSRFELATG